MAAINPLYAPKLIGLTEIPPATKATYTDVLRQLPDDQALVFEYQSKDAVRRAQNVIPCMAQKIGLVLSTRSYETPEHMWRLLVWKRRADDRPGYHATLSYPAVVQFIPVNGRWA